ncbi:MAG: MGMT family protein [Bacteroidia bacterium]|nr:MGMT family protein [Bacteroidia bacterium]
MNRNDFYRDVAEVVALIPYGRVTSYGAIAEYLGTKGSARMVGYAMHSLAEGSLPAHRVVNRSGKLTGHIHFFEPSMAERLISEGVAVEENQIIHFEKHFWSPLVELKL